MKTISIEEIWKKRFPHGTLPPYAKEMMIDFGRQLLELAAENAIWDHTEQLIHTDKHGNHYSGKGLFVDKKSITDTINQIK